MTSLIFFTLSNGKRCALNSNHLVAIQEMESGVAFTVETRTGNITYQAVESYDVILADTRRHH